MERKTRQKQTIQKVLEKAQAPLTPTEILKLASKRAPGLGIATVYRSLKVLMREHQVKAVQIGEESPRYETTNRGHHHHFLCRGCGKIFELCKCFPQIKALAPAKFKVEDHDVTLYGRCVKCAQKNILRLRNK